MSWLDELEKLEKEATPGPFKVTRGQKTVQIAEVAPSTWGRGLVARFYMWAHRGCTAAVANAEFFAALRNEAERLLRIARAARNFLAIYDAAEIGYGQQLDDLRAALEDKQNG